MASPGGAWHAGLAARPRLAALLGAACIAFAAIFVRLADVSPTTATVFRCLYALPVLGVLALLERHRYGPRAGPQLRMAMLAGVFFAIDLTAFHYAIGLVGAGLATVLANLQVVIVAVVAWMLLGERPSGRLIVSIPLAILGAVLISGLLEQGAYGSDPGLGVGFGLLAAVTYAGYLLILRRSGADLRRPAGPVFESTAAALLVAAAGGLAIGGLDLAPSWPAHGWLLALALVAQAAGGLLIVVSLPRLPAALTSITLTAQPIGTMVLGVALLGERPSPGQLAGVGLILAGLLIASVSRARTLPAPAT
ncbi:DMT family transporter [soil metagenome]